MIVSLIWLPVLTHAISIIGGFSEFDVLVKIS